jgi:hypothetical protein
LHLAFGDAFGDEDESFSGDEVPLLEVVFVAVAAASEGGLFDALSSVSCWCVSTR